MAEKQHATVGIIVAIASIVLVLAAFGFVIYQRRGKRCIKKNAPFPQEPTVSSFPWRRPVSNTGSF